MSNAEVLAFVRKFVSCIKAKDRATMVSMILPTGYGTIIRNGVPLTMGLPAIVDRTPWESPIEHNEEIFNEVVHVDHDLAVAWTPYRVRFGNAEPRCVDYEKVFVGGVLHHEGTNVISLWKSDKGWLVTGIADTSRTPDGRRYEQPAH